MLITVDTRTHLAEAAPAATSSSCRQGLGFGRSPWTGENRALAGRPAR
jgi:hypothetical protein